MSAPVSPNCAACRSRRSATTARRRRAPPSRRWPSGGVDERAHDPPCQTVEASVAFSAHHLDRRAPIGRVPANRPRPVRLTRTDRRRLAFASALTAVAFPAVLWEHERGDVVNRSNIAAVGVPAAGEEAVAAPGPSAPLAEPAYLAPIDDPAGTAAGASVMVGRSDDELVGRGEATFRRE